MENKKEDISYPKFLENKPCGQDLFEGKSHNKIAENIAKVIENNNAKIIGIDGGWGSGKSNMVKLIKQKLESYSNKYHFFVYDAWGHQTDFQRRSILENLTGFLVDDEKILEKNTWDAKLLQLLSRKRSIGSKIVKELSAVSKVSVIIAFTMPLLVFFSGLINENIFKLFYWIIIFALSLILLLYLQIRNMRKYGQSVKFSNIINELFLSYMDYTNDKSKDNIEQSIKYETIYDEEPSSRDFRNWMKAINKDLKNHTLIIVFDNMDRLPREKVQELWASIHTFFAEEYYSNIRIIVPFDREHIKSAFKSEDFSANQGTKEIDPYHNNRIVCYGNDFINKTFDVIYRVSPPIMYDWKTYFEKCWKDAFGKDINYKITQIYDFLTDVITPREIIAFINEFVSIKQITCESIPDEYIALFIKGKDIISKHPDDEILNPTYLGTLYYSYKEDPQLSQYISALYYQLPVDKALDTIYVEKLKKALDNGDIDQIKLIQSQPHLFSLIIEKAITKVSNIYNAIIALDKCLSNKNSQQEQSIWNNIYNKHIQPNTINEPIKEYQKILLKRITKKEDYLNRLISDLYKIHDFSAISFYNDIKQLSEIEGINPLKFIKEKEVDAEQFIKFVEEVKDDYKKYKIACKQDKLDEYLSKLEVSALKNIHAIPFIKKDYNLPAYLSNLSALFDSNLKNMGNIIIIYNKLKEIEKPITKKLPDAQIVTFFNQTKPTDDFHYDLISMRISRLSNFQNNLQQPFNTSLNSTNADIAMKVSEKIEFYISYEDIILNAENMDFPLYNAVAKNITEKNWGTSIINNIVAVVQKYDYIKRIGIDSEKFINRIDSMCNDVSSKITIETINNIPISFYKDIMVINNNLTNICKDTAKKYLGTKTKEDWKKAIISDGFEFQLLKIIRQDTQACFDAFKELLVENIQANNIAFSKEKSKSLIELFITNGRDLLSTFNNVRDRFCSGSYTMTNVIFNYYGEWLLKYAKLEEKSSALRTIFPPSVLDDPQNVQLILMYQDNMIKIVENAGNENNDFKDKKNDLLSNGNFKEDKNFEIFAKHIGVYLNSEKKE